MKKFKLESSQINLKSLNKLSSFLTIGIVAAIAAINAGQAQDLDEVIKMKSEKYDVDVKLIKAIIKAESSYNIYALSPKGAMGLMQLMPATAKRFGIGKDELYVAEKNIEAGVKYLSFLKSMFDNNLSKVIAAYNAGEKAVIRYGGIPPYKETINYVKKVHSYLNQPIMIAKTKKTNKKVIKIASEKRTKYICDSLTFCDSGEL